MTLSMSLAVRPTSFNPLLSLLADSPYAPLSFPVSLLPAPVSTSTLPCFVRIRRQLSPRLTLFHLSGFIFCSHKTLGICPNIEPPSYFMIPSLRMWIDGVFELTMTASCWHCKVREVPP